MRHATFLAAGAAAAMACSSSRSASAPPTAPVATAPAPAPAPAPAGLREVVFHGMCDASAAVPISSTRFVVADDEDNLLRIYDAEAGGAPLSMSDVSVGIGLEPKGKRMKYPEADVEGGTRLGDRAYWLTSHGRDKKGKLRPERIRFFATTLADGELRVVGHAYEHLLRDLVAAPELARFGLAAAAELAPKEAGGLNIEGLTAGPDDTVLLAFRNPIPEGRALVVPLLNVRELVDTADAGPARFGPPVQLDLGGRGVRSLSYWHGRYLVIGGHYTEGAGSQLYAWDGSAAGQLTWSVDLSGYNPEAFFTPEERDEILVLSDDGSRLVDGVPCKDLEDPAAKRFRGVWVRPPAR